MRDSKNVTAVCDLPDTEEQRQALAAKWAEDVPRAQRIMAQTVLRNGGDKQEVEEMLMMLGVHPTQKDTMLVNAEIGPGAALREFNPSGGKNKTKGE